MTQHLRVPCSVAMVFALAMVAGACGESKGDTASNGSPAASSAGASTTGSGGPVSCSGALTKLMSCGLEATEEFPCPGQPTEQQSCEAQCVIDSTCEDLEASFCGASLNLNRCLETCLPQFTCDNGLTILEEERCDGEDSCLDMSDETGCSAGELSLCPDGAALSRFKICDGIVDCSDSFDEQGCTTEEVVYCDGTNYVSRRYACDGFADCSNGADEADCPAFVVCP